MDEIKKKKQSSLLCFILCFSFVFLCFIPRSLHIGMQPWWHVTVWCGGICLYCFLWPLWEWLLTQKGTEPNMLISARFSWWTSCLPNLREIPGTYVPVPIPPTSQHWLLFEPFPEQLTEFSHTKSTTSQGCWKDGTRQGQETSVNLCRVSLHPCDLAMSDGCYQCTAEAF
jgi:hypothetical protein